MKVFTVNVEDNGYFTDGLPTKEIDRFCVQKQMSMFGDDYTVVNYDDPVVIETKEKYADFYQDCKDINRYNTFANLVRLKYMQKHFETSDEPILYLDTDIYLNDNWHYERAFGKFPEFGLLQNGFAIIYAEKVDEINKIIDYYDKYDGNAWNYVDKRVIEAIGPFDGLRCGIIHFTSFHKEQTDTDNPNSPFHGHYDFFADNAEEFFQIISKEYDRPVKIFMAAINSMSYEKDKGYKVIAVPDDILPVVKKEFGCDKVNEEVFCDYEPSVKALSEIDRDHNLIVYTTNLDFLKYAHDKFYVRAVLEKPEGIKEASVWQ